MREGRTSNEIVGNVIHANEISITARTYYACGVFLTILCHGATGDFNTGKIFYGTLGTGAVFSSTASRKFLPDDWIFFLDRSSGGQVLLGNGQEAIWLL